MRYRDLETGTFLTRDPIGYADGPNVYCYVHCNPITHFDALGLSDTSESAALKAAEEAAAAAEAAAQAAAEAAAEAATAAEEAQKAAQKFAENNPNVFSEAAQKKAQEASQRAKDMAATATEMNTEASYRRQYADLLSQSATAEAADALDWAVRHVGDPNYGYRGAVDEFGPNSLKCNKFGNDAYEKGANVDFPNRTTFGFERDGPPLANDLADPSRNYDNFPVVSGAPMPGDVLAFPAPGDSGHVAIYGGVDNILQGGAVSGSMSSFNAMKASHGGNVTIRRYTD